MKLGKTSKKGSKLTLSASDGNLLNLPHIRKDSSECISIHSRNSFVDQEVDAYSVERLPTVGYKQPSQKKCKTSANARAEVAHALTVEDQEITTGLIRRENRDHSVLVNNSQI